MDYDGDGHLDLVVTGEWMPVRVFHQEGGRFVDRTAAVGLAGSEGWWNSITVADLNRDGRPDLVLGNLGFNSYVRATAKEPARLYVDDFANDGSLEQILTFYKHGVSYPLPGRDELAQLLPALRSRYPTYADFGASRIEDILPAASLARATVRQATDFASSVAINEGNGRFSLHALPVEAQFAPVRTALAGDFDGDGTIDVLVAGNFFAVTPVIGRYDASYGQLLHGLGNGRFTAVDMTVSGLELDGQVRHLAELRTARGGRLIVAARNDTTLQLIQAVRFQGVRVVEKR